jgi:hypothetical protein
MVQDGLDLGRLRHMAAEASSEPGGGPGEDPDGAVRVAGDKRAQA